MATVESYVSKTHLENHGRYPDDGHRRLADDGLVLRAVTDQSLMMRPTWSWQNGGGFLSSGSIGT
jgi:hypothetical protein